MIGVRRCVMRSLAVVVVVLAILGGCTTIDPPVDPTSTSSVAPSIAATGTPTTPLGTVSTTGPVELSPTTIPVPSTTTLPPSPNVENLGLAASWVVQLDDGVAFGVNESEQGADLSDDGDTDDVVVHVVSDATVVNTRLQVVTRSHRRSNPSGIDQLAIGAQHPQRLCVGSR
jgi:hypothetical protein